MSEMTAPERRSLSGTGRPLLDQEKRTARWIWLSIGIVILLATGCLRIPEESRTISHRGSFEISRQASDCTAACLGQSGSEESGPDQVAPALDAGGFSLVSWNIFKGKKEGWDEDFRKFSRNTDILLLQEAYLTEKLKKMLHQAEYQWDMTAAFEYRQIEAGVLTASRTAPNFSCTFRETEPITRIPKSVLITRYPMTETDRELLVANIHGINFTINNSAFQKQIDRLEDILVAHQGPMIVSGDFNTWNTGRMALVNALAEGLDLTAVSFNENRRSRVFGYGVDHVYYRGLEAKNATIPIVSTSDHNPLTVIFKLPDASASGH